ncbi:peroxidase 2-like [Aegilops tauschii subsp. strangulata]|uniref:peroxidase 2-like n=1 Tax=Aegilops tauschii subsp. strangulata TaxID=200361 RepID=UPI001E1CA71B|nr:lignin-forming anionic peroxidase-like [Aegilops tauschii subsp. strangulata]
MASQGCDASVLLDTAPFSASEKDVEPNASLTGYTVIDDIKSHDCPATVSCADVIALASRDAIALLGGPTWSVPLGRKDSRFAANPESTEKGLPSPHDILGELVTMFSRLNLDARDMTALSDAHTVGMADCMHYSDRVYSTDRDEEIDPSFAQTMQLMCQGPSGKAPFDVQTPMRFDNAYYRNLIARRGLLTSDQTLYGGGGLQDNLVEMYSTDGEAFARDFAKAMVKMGNVPPPMGMPVEVRLKCSTANY